MAQPPLDPFEGYLEVLKVIQILQRRRKRLLTEIQSSGESDVPAFPSADSEGDEMAGAQLVPSPGSPADFRALIARVDAGIFEAEALQLVYEERMEEELQGAADHADAVRSLLLSISERLEEMESWLSEAVSGLSDEDMEEWDRLKADYTRLKDQIGLKTPPQEP
jgi:hypothetical protein